MTCNHRRDFLKHSALALAAASSTLVLRSAGAQEAPSGKIYVCPPCGCSMDGQEFKEPGTCPACGMALIEKPQDTPAQPRVAILVFENVQIIDFAGPYEVFGAAGYDVFIVGATKTPINTFMNLTITPRYSFADCPPVDVLMTPGGGIGNAVRQSQVLDWVRTRSAESKHTLSVCNGAFFLAASGLLDGLSATTYYGAIDGLKWQFPRVKVVSDRRFVDNGRIVTTAGLSSGIDGALHIVSKLSGHAAAQMVALNMEYNWREDVTYARAMFADRHLRRIFGTRLQLPLPAGFNAKVESTAGDRDIWEARWLIRTASAAPAVTQAIADVIAGKSEWKAASASPASARRNWTFVDDARRSWSAGLDTEQAGEPQTFLTTMKLRGAS